MSVRDICSPRIKGKLLSLLHPFGEYEFLQCTKSCCIFHNVYFLFECIFLCISYGSLLIFFIATLGLYTVKLINEYKFQLNL